MRVFFNAGNCLVKKTPEYVNFFLIEQVFIYERGYESFNLKNFCILGIEKESGQSTESSTDVEMNWPENNDINHRIWVLCYRPFAVITFLQ